jgi:hypothetical protein
VVKNILEPEVVAKLGLLGGLNKEGELNGIWRRTQQPGLWFAMGIMPSSFPPKPQ